MWQEMTPQALDAHLAGIDFESWEREYWNKCRDSDEDAALDDFIAECQNTRKEWKPRSDGRITGESCDE